LPGRRRRCLRPSCCHPPRWSIESLFHINTFALGQSIPITVALFLSFSSLLFFLGRRILLQMIQLATLFAAGLLVIPSANAFWRLPCSQPVLNSRVDPIVNPGKPSSHSHTIVGSNGASHRKPSVKSRSDLVLAIGFDTTFDSLRASNCSTCKVKDDKSAYWTPELVRSWLARKCTPDMTS
jgi:hypothetical protein